MSEHYIKLYGQINVERAKSLSELFTAGDVITDVKTECLPLTLLPIPKSSMRLIITHVDHWGVYAVPTSEFMSRLFFYRRDNTINKNVLTHFKGHIKIKWCNLNTVQLR